MTGHVAQPAGAAAPELVFTGRVWKFGDAINTDVMHPGAANKLPEAERPYACMESIRPGWSRQAQRGDILVAGRNFGCGSSRPASYNLQQIGIACAVVESASRIFFRNSVSLAFPVMIAPGITDLCEEGDVIVVQFETGLVTNTRTEETLQGEAMPSDSPPMQIIRAGGMTAFLREWMAKHPKPVAR